MGAKGVLYFTYWDDPDGQHYGFGNSIITRRALPDSYNQSDCYPSLTCPSDYVKGEPPRYRWHLGCILLKVPAMSLLTGPHWYDARQINSIVLAFAKLLLTAKSTAVHHLGGLPGSHPDPVPGTGANLTSCMVRSLEGAADPTGLRGHFLLGEFELEDGRTAILIHNQDPARTQWATVTFAPELNVPRNASGVLEVDPIHATLAPLLDDSPLHPGLQIGLKPGMARFLVAAPKRQRMRRTANQS